MKQYLSMTTKRSDLRSAAIGWGNIEDPRLVVQGKSIGHTPCIHGPTYDCVLRALADGWELLGPSESLDDGTFSWDLVRDCDHGSAREAFLPEFNRQMARMRKEEGR